MLGLTLAAGIAVGIIGHQLLSALHEPVKRQVLMKTDLAGTLKPGGIIHQPPRQAHEGKNASKADPVKILAFYLSEKGQPLTSQVK